MQAQRIVMHGINVAQVRHYSKPWVAHARSLAREHSAIADVQLT